MTERTGVTSFFLVQRLLQCLTTAEYSIFPAAALEVRDELGLSEVDLGLIGSLTYAGIAVGSLMAPKFFNLLGPAKLCKAAMLVSVVATIATITAPGKECIFAARCLAGFAHAALYAYFPVWIDRFAPPGQESKWMGTYCTMGAVANLASYALTAYCVYVMGWSWRYNFAGTGTLVLLLAAGAAWVPAELWEVGTPTGIAAGFGTLLQYPAFWCLGFILSIEWYTVAALEYFGLEFAHYLGASAEQAAKLYVMAGCGLALGCAFGATVSDMLGGYAERGKALTFCKAVTIMPLPMVPYLLKPDYFGLTAVHTMGMAAMFLSFYAAITPVITGMALRTVPRAKSTEASSVLQFLYTSLGFMLGPAIAGVVADRQGLPACWFVTFAPAVSIPGFLYLASMLETDRKDSDRKDFEPLTDKVPEPVGNPQERSPTAGTGLTNRASATA